MENRNPENVTRPRSCGRVCSLQLTFERQQRRRAVSDLRHGFFVTKNCTASGLKAQSSLLYPSAVCLLDF